MGKPIGEALAEVDKCARNCDYYADAAPAMLADAAVAGVPGTFLAYEPIGVVLAIMPWNYPLWQVIRFLAPALAAGNGDRKSVVWGKSGSVRVDLGGRRNIKKKKR